MCRHYTVVNRDYMSAMNGKTNSSAQNRASEQWVRPIGRIDAARTAEILGFQEHDIPVLVLHELLKPLGKPAPNARKYFAATEIYELAQDRDWLNKATRVLYQHWQTKNANRTKDDSAPPASASSD